jgi:hypothetical protein
MVEGAPFDSPLLWDVDTSLWDFVLEEEGRVWAEDLKDLHGLWSK